MKRTVLIFLILFSEILCLLRAQTGNYTFNLTALPVFTTKGNMPFWFRSNQYGSIPLDGASVSLIGSAGKDYNKQKSSFFDWGASFQGRVNVGYDVNFKLVEGYGKIRLSIFEIMAGRSKDGFGLRDTSLTSGSFSVSGNSLGIPKIQISIPDFFIIPGLSELFAFKGHYMHGWIGEIGMKEKETLDTVLINSFFHQKSFYGRFGKPEWRLKLYGGFNHQTFWGNEADFYNEDFILSPFITYLYVITGKAYSNGSIQETRLGDHLGTIDIGFEYNFNKFKLFLYRQNFYEAGALWHLANIQDGLNGISISNKIEKNRFITWNKFIFEFLYTKNQAGQPWSPPTPSPYEPYYNHYQYVEGWSYKGIGLGTPFITTRAFTRTELPSSPLEHFINNRVLLLHWGIEGSVASLNYTIRTSWSKNYGTYRTTDEEQSTDISNPGYYGIFGLQKQFSAYLECFKELDNRLRIGLLTAFDIGELYYNSFGIMLSVSQSF